jgi:hypothetical protein
VLKAYSSKGVLFLTDGITFSIDDYWNRCNSWVNSTITEVETDNETYTHKSQSKTKRKCNDKIRKNLDKLSW